MIMSFIDIKTDRFRFSIISTIFAFIIGLICYFIPIAAEHIYFFLSAPISTFISCYFIWHWTFKSNNDYKIGNVVMIGVILTFICHYLNFVLLGFGRIICNYLTGNYADYTGQTESILGTLTYITFIQILISLYKLGLITWIMFIIVGIYVIKTSTSINKKISMS